jgi:hypothetical protein
MKKLTKAPTQEDFVLLRNRLDQGENHSATLRKNLFDVEKKIK